MKSVGYQERPSEEVPGCPQFCRTWSVSEVQKREARIRTRFVVRRNALVCAVRIVFGKVGEVGKGRDEKEERIGEEKVKEKERKEKIRHTRWSSQICHQRYSN